MSYTQCQTEEPTIRIIIKPSTAKCDKDKYTWFLLAASLYAGCTRLAEILGLSHDSVNRFLLRERYSAKRCIPDRLREQKTYLDIKLPSYLIVVDVFRVYIPQTFPLFDSNR
ncbi:MAG: hypothetical protein F6K10_26000, partial [Moorea sp. SIO2B7]|nr:hypothetical protein [Moorena sp. SIO2B7]